MRVSGKMKNVENLYELIETEIGEKNKQRVDGLREKLVEGFEGEFPIEGKRRRREKEECVGR